jgi:hypothetical protein
MTPRDPTPAKGTKRVARPFLMSLLTRQLMLLQKPGFLAQHPYAWLVWEVGTAVVPRSSSESSSGSTRIPDSKGPPSPEAGDPLCFELSVPDEEDLRLKVGRAAESHLVISDMTVSREQFELHHSQGYWAVLNSAGAKTAVGVIESPHKPIVLRDHAVIKAGGVRFTFYGPEAFVARVLQAADEPV